MKMRMNLLLGCIAFLVMVSGVQAQTTITFQPGFDNAFVTDYRGLEDNMMLDDWTGFGWANCGATNSNWIGNGSNSGARRSIQRWTGLEVLNGHAALAGLTLTSATVTIVKANGVEYSGNTDGISVYAISDANAGWVEGTGNYEHAALNGGASWEGMEYTGGAFVPWVGGGGALGSGDSNMEVGDLNASAPRVGKFGGGFDGALQDTITANPWDPTLTEYTYSLDTALVMQWISGGTNAGVILKQDNERHNYDSNDHAGTYSNINPGITDKIQKIEFWSAEADVWAPDADKAPILTLVYDVAGALLVGDANRDGQVSAGDYASVQANFGNTGAQNDPLLFGDANLDGQVSAGDYASVQANFGNVLGAAVPEPGTMCILSLGIVALIKRRK